MDRKIKNKHLDKPTHQRWLYQLSDIGLVKAIMLIWGVCILIIVITLVLVKYTLAWIKH